MMMEEEIERTKEEIRGIEEACEKVEKVLDGVIRTQPPTITQEDVDIEKAEGDEGKMEDIFPAADETVSAQVEKTIPPAVASDKKWFEDKALLDLWNDAA